MCFILSSSFHWVDSLFRKTPPKKGNRTMKAASDTWRACRMPCRGASRANPPGSSSGRHACARQCTSTSCRRPQTLFLSHAASFFCGQPWWSLVCEDVDQCVSSLAVCPAHLATKPSCSPCTPLQSGAPSGSLTCGECPPRMQHQDDSRKFL